MDRLAKNGLLDRLPIVKLSMCESCLPCKVAIKPFEKALRALKFIYSDICGPMSCVFFILSYAILE